MKKLKHIVEYIFLLILIYSLRMMSVDNSANFCAFFARMLGPYLRVTKIAKQNIERVYGSKIDYKKTIDDLWDNYGRYIGEFPFINTLNSDDLNKRVKIVGLEKIEHLRKANQPFMLFLAHQANWDFVIRRINDIYPKFAIIYRKANNPYIDAAILKDRTNKDSVMMIAKGVGGAKSIVRAIKDRSSIAMLVDQKMNDGIEVPFFGLKAMTAPAIAKLSLQYNYPIVPLQIVRIGRTSNFELIIHDPLPARIGNNAQNCYDTMVEINKIVEGWIRQNPSQWLWFHNRWKN